MSTYMEARDNTLFSRNFIGDRLPINNSQKENLKQKALNHPDYPQMYLSENCEYGGIVIRTDFNAESSSLSKDKKGPDEPDKQISFDDDYDLAFEEAEIDNQVIFDDLSQEINQTDIKEYPLFMNEIRKILADPAYSDALEFYPVGNPVLMDFFTTAVINDMGRLMSFVLLLIIIDR